jgi:thioesterase domain-containing protein
MTGMSMDAVDVDAACLLSAVRVLNPGLDEKTASELSAIGAFAAMLARCKALNLLPPELTLKEAEKRLKIYRAIMEAARIYYPGSLPFPVHLFAVAGGQGGDLSHGWQGLLGKWLHIRSVSGTHIELMEPPHVQVLAQRLAAALNAAETNPAPVSAAHSPLLTIQGGSSGIAPVFCVPGAGASVACFMPFSMALGRKVPVYGLQPRGFDGICVPHSTVTAAAKSYVDAIRQIAPHGPYRLVGHSFGGWVAMEVAHLLMDAGEPVAPVLVLDSRAPLHGERMRQRHFDRYQAIEKLLVILGQAAGKRLELNVDELRPLSEEEQLALLLKRMVAVGLLPRNSRPATIRAMLRVFYTNINTAWRPLTPFAGEVILVGARHADGYGDGSGEARNGDRYANWRMHAPLLTVLEVEANHMGMLNTPVINSIVDRIL